MTGAELKAALDNYSAGYLAHSDLTANQLWIVVRKIRELANELESLALERTATDKQINRSFDAYR